LSARTLLQSLEQKQAARPDTGAVQMTAPEPTPVVITAPQAVLPPPVDAGVPGEVTPRNVPADVVSPSVPAASKVASASVNRNRRQNVNCRSILERAQIGELSADDHALLQKECR
jgi:hypothetical protein